MRALFIGTCAVYIHFWILTRLMSPEAAKIAKNVAVYNCTEYVRRCTVDMI